MASMKDIEEDFDEQAEEELEAAEPEELDDEEAIEELEVDLDEEDLDDETREELKVVDEALSQKELNARALAIRRVLEERAEQKRLQEELDYLDDLDDPNY